MQPTVFPMLKRCKPRQRQALTLFSNHFQGIFLELCGFEPKVISNCFSVADRDCQRRYHGEQFWTGENILICLTICLSRSPFLSKIWKFSNFLPGFTHHSYQESVNQSGIALFLPISKEQKYFCLHILNTVHSTKCQFFWRKIRLAFKCIQCNFTWFLHLYYLINSDSYFHRSREVAADPLAEEEPDVWYSTSKLFMDHINEVSYHQRQEVLLSYNLIIGYCGIRPASSLWIKSVLSLSSSPANFDPEYEIEYAVPTVWFWPIFNILQLFLQIQRSHNWVNGSKKARKLVVKAVIGSIAQICGGKWVRCKNKPQTSSTRGTCCNISTVFDVITCFLRNPI